MEKTTYLRRAVEPLILEDLARKMVFIGGRMPYFKIGNNFDSVSFPFCKETK
jgi:hypothetical protein